MLKLTDVDGLLVIVCLEEICAVYTQDAGTYIWFKNRAFVIVKETVEQVAECITKAFENSPY